MQPIGKALLYMAAALLAALSCAGAIIGCSAAREGVSYQAYGGTAIVSTDGRVITVGPYLPVDCAATVTPMARESEKQVALFLRDVTPHHPPTCAPAPPNVGVTAEAFVTAYNIGLRQPLGNRKLVDGSTGQAIAWISARLLLYPAALRTSERLLGIKPEGYLSGTPEITAGAVEYYVQVDDRHGLDSGTRTDPTIVPSVVVAQGAGSVQMPGPGPGGWTPIRVHGHPGRATHNLITWRENGLTDYIEAETAAATNPQVLTTQQLIAFADSAPTYNTKPLPILRG